MNDATFSGSETNLQITGATKRTKNKVQTCGARHRTAIQEENRGK